MPTDPNKKDLTDAEAKAKADQIQKQVQGGGDFAAIAKAESDDKGSGLKGGDLGNFSPWRMDPVFSKALLGLQKNQVKRAGEDAIRVSHHPDARRHAADVRAGEGRGRAGAVERAADGTGRQGQDRIRPELLRRRGSAPDSTRRGGARAG